MISKNKQTIDDQNCGISDSEIYEEQQIVDLEIANRGPVQPAMLEHLNADMAIWRVRVPDQEDKFVCLKNSQNDDNWFVVMVDANKFYRTWLQRRDAFGRHGLCVLRQKMHSDYKFKWAIEGFSHGVKNPVPLANCNGHMGEDGIIYLNFNDGVTRTFWLLANRAESFPIKTYGETLARYIHCAAGIGDGPVIVSDLFLRRENEKSEFNWKDFRYGS